MTLITACYVLQKLQIAFDNKGKSCKLEKSPHIFKATNLFRDISRSQYLAGLYDRDFDIHAIVIEIPKNIHSCKYLLTHVNMQEVLFIHKAFCQYQ